MLALLKKTRKSGLTAVVPDGEAVAYACIDGRNPRPRLTQAGFLQADPGQAGLWASRDGDKRVELVVVRQPFSPDRELELRWRAAR